MAGGDDHDDAEAAVIKERQARADAKQAEALKVKQKIEAEKKAAQEAKAAAEAKEWERAKELLEVKAAEREETEKARRDSMSPGDAVLYAIEQLSIRAAEAEEHVQRSERLAKVLGEDAATSMKKRARRNSKELQEQMMKLMDSNLDEAFKQFDLDGNGTLDADELASAYEAAGMTISPSNLKKAIRLLDTNGDGVIDKDEFKQIAVKIKMMDAQ